MQIDGMWCFCALAGLRIQGFTVDGLGLYMLKLGLCIQALLISSVNVQLVTLEPFNLAFAFSSRFGFSWLGLMNVHKQLVINMFVPCTQFVLHTILRHISCVSVNRSMLALTYLNQGLFFEGKKTLKALMQNYKHASNFGKIP